MDNESQGALAAAAGWNLTDAWLNHSAAPDINSFYFYETEQFTLLWVLFTFIVVGNSAVLVALLLGKNRKSRMKFFIMHLALADLSVGLISVGTDIVWRITVEWNAGNAACKIIKFLQCVVTYSSTYVLVALSIDRYDAITHPMNFSGSWRRARILIATAWLLSIIFSLPIIIFYEEKLIQGRLQCWIHFDKQWQWQVYMTLVSVKLFLAPALIISACYLVIVITIWSKSRLLVPPRRFQNGDASDAEADSRRASSRGIIPRAKIKTVKMTFGIVFVFILCWSPYILFDLLQVFGYVPETQTNIALASFVQSLAPLNSAANPLIYCVFSTHICRSLRRVPPLAWLLCCCGVPSGRRQEPSRGRCFRYLYSATDSSSVTDTLTNPVSTLSSLKHRQQNNIQNLNIVVVNSSV
ncbi:CCAP-receptor [Frankliniella occidentalis]|uniref:Cardioacceleratory peptide receptor-like n=1 Tax=Frankliniella occidentalis TaxID=133901 RepID=A0A9C6WXK3_FRAOC|nr:cardioacceleratory peptide receptor-like [Frankliniella occidentalis]KAE8747391.1 CCAP-receptor [Frankliniella occidentalis]